MREWWRRVKLNRAEYVLFVAAHRGNLAAEKAWYELVKDRRASSGTPPADKEASE